MNNEKKQEEIEDVPIGFRWVREGIVSGTMPLVCGWIAFQISDNMNVFIATSVCVCIIVALCVRKIKRSSAFTIAYTVTLIPVVITIIRIIPMVRSGFRWY